MRVLWAPRPSAAATSACVGESTRRCMCLGSLHCPHPSAGQTRVRGDVALRPDGGGQADEAGDALLRAVRHVGAPAGHGVRPAGPGRQGDAAAAKHGGPKIRLGRMLTVGCAALAWSAAQRRPMPGWFTEASPLSVLENVPLLSTDERKKLAQGGNKEYKPGERGREHVHHHRRGRGRGEDGQGRHAGDPGGRRLRRRAGAACCRTRSATRACRPRRWTTSSTCVATTRRSSSSTTPCNACVNGATLSPFVIVGTKPCLRGGGYR